MKRWAQVGILACATLGGGLAWQQATTVPEAMHAGLRRAPCFYAAEEPRPEPAGIVNAFLWNPDAAMDPNCVELPARKRGR